RRERDLGGVQKKCSSCLESYCNYRTCKLKIKGRKACVHHRCTFTNSCKNPFVFEHNNVKYCYEHNICSLCSNQREPDSSVCEEHRDNLCIKDECLNVKIRDSFHCVYHTCLFHKHQTIKCSELATHHE